LQTGVDLQRAEVDQLSERTIHHFLAAAELLS
jgi:hypothetical protein